MRVKYYLSNKFVRHGHMVFRKINGIIMTQNWILFVVVALTDKT